MLKTIDKYCSYETWIQPSWSVSYRLNTSVNLCGQRKGGGGGGMFYCVRRKISFGINEKCPGLKWKLDGRWIIKESEMCLHNSALLWAWIPEQLCCDSGGGAKSIHYRCDVRTWRDNKRNRTTSQRWNVLLWTLTWSTIQHWMKSSNATCPFRCRSNFSISVP